MTVASNLCLTMPPLGEFGCEHPLLSAAFDSAPMGLYIADANGTPVYANAACRTLYNLKGASEFLDPLVRLSRVHPGDRERVSRSWRQGTSECASGECEFRVLRRDGSMLEVLVRTQPLFDASGMRIGTVGTVDDKTQSRAQERAAEEKQQHFAAVLDAVGAGIWRYEVQHARFHSDARCNRLLGLSAQDQVFPLRDLAQWIHPKDLARWRDDLDRGLEGEPQESEVRVRHGDGVWVCLRFRCQVVSRTAQGQPEWLLGALVDVTARRQQDEAMRATEERLFRAGQMAKVGGFSCNLATGDVSLSRSAAVLLGVERDTTLHARDLLERHPPEARQQVEAAAKSAKDTGKPIQIEVPMMLANAVMGWVRLAFEIDTGKDDAATHLLCMAMDITDTVAQRRALQVAQTRAALATDIGGIGTWSWDAKTGMVQLDALACCALDLPASVEQMHATDLLTLVHPDDRAAGADCIEAGMKSGQAIRHSFRTTQSLGNTRQLLSTANLRYDDQGNLQGLDGSIQDVTALSAITTELSYRATHDDLTGLVNRSEFMQTLARLLKPETGGQTRHALLYIDLDQFKLVNEVCGYAAGDQLLSKVSQILRESVRKTDTLARLGGDEFAVLLKDCPMNEAERVGQKICSALEISRFDSQQHSFRVGASIGLVLVDAQWSDAIELMKAAESCCYAAEATGHNRVHVWEPDDMALQVRRGETDWAARLTRSLDDKRFVLFAQRIAGVNASASGVHAEVLIRLRDTDESLIGPDAFLGVAERFRMISRIDRWVLSEVLAVLDDHYKRGEIDRIDALCVNLSGQSVADEQFLRAAHALLQAAAEPVRKRLCLEITETAVITDLAAAARFIDDMHALGVRVALDDFGAGASSFSYLRSLQVDVLKIDGQFVRQLLEDPINEVAVRCFIELARVRGAKTVAEFVDRQDVLERLQELQVDYAQGYLFHKPEPLEHVLRLGGVWLWN